MLYSQIPYDTFQPYRHGVDTPTGSPPRSHAGTPLPAAHMPGAGHEAHPAEPRAAPAPSPLRHVSGGAAAE